MLYAGVDPKTVQYLAGHENSKTTMQDVIFENTPKEQHQTLIAILEFGVNVGTAEWVFPSL